MKVAEVAGLKWNCATGQLVGLRMKNIDQVGNLSDLFSSRPEVDGPESSVKGASQSKRIPMTQKVLQFLWRDNSSKLSIIGPYFEFDNGGVSANQLQSIVITVVDHFHSIGLQTSCIVADGAQTNMSHFKQMADAMGGLNFHEYVEHTIQFHEKTKSRAIAKNTEVTNHTDQSANVVTMSVASTATCETTRAAICTDDSTCDQYDAVHGAAATSISPTASETSAIDAIHIIELQKVLKQRLVDEARARRFHGSADQSPSSRIDDLIKLASLIPKIGDAPKICVPHWCFPESENVFIFFQVDPSHMMKSLRNALLRTLSINAQVMI